MPTRLRSTPPGFVLFLTAVLCDSACVIQRIEAGPTNTAIAASARSVARMLVPLLLLLQHGALVSPWINRPSHVISARGALTRSRRLIAATDADALDPSRDDPYSIVGVARDASREAIRRAYRRKAQVLHPDVNDDPDSASNFRRLVAAFEALMDDQTRALFDTARKRSSARSRAAQQWEDISRRTYGSTDTAREWGRQSASASQRPAGSRREAEERTREESEARRRRWREMAFEEVWREHMPLNYTAPTTHRASFVAALEVAVQAHVRAQRDASSSDATSATSGGAGGSEGGVGDAGDAAGAGGRGAADAEAAETALLSKLTNREVLRSELSDAHHRTTKHRERARWLEAELALATKKAGMWRGATPASEADRVQGMERELAFLELANRLRERLGEQREALALLRKRERAIQDRLATLKLASERAAERASRESR